MIKQLNEFEVDEMITFRAFMDALERMMHHLRFHGFIPKYEIYMNSMPQVEFKEGVIKVINLSLHSVNCEGIDIRGTYTNGNVIHLFVVTDQKKIFWVFSEHMVLSDEFLIYLKECNKDDT